MSQSNDPPAPCADKGGHGMAKPPLRCAILFVQKEARGQKRRNLARVTIFIVTPPTGKKKRNY